MIGSLNLPLSTYTLKLAVRTARSPKAMHEWIKVFSLVGPRLKDLEGCAAMARMCLWGCQVELGAEGVLLLSHASKKSFSFLDTLGLCQPPAREPKIGLLVRPTAWELGPAPSRETGLHLGCSLP